MRTSWQLMKWRGVPVVFSWTVLLGLPVFLAVYRGNWVKAVTGFLALLLLLLIHELGHAAVAKWRRIPVIEIRLHLLHGLCRYERPEKEADSVWIAWGGVAAQAVLFLVALGIGALLKSISFTAWLWTYPAFNVWVSANILILMLNLIPMGPLDGATAWRAVPVLWKKVKRDQRLRQESKAVTADIIESLKKRR